MRSNLDAQEVEAGAVFASTLLAIYRYFSPTRRRLASLEAGQLELKALITSHAESVDLKFTNIYNLMVKDRIPTRRR